MLKAITRQLITLIAMFSLTLNSQAWRSSLYPADWTPGAKNIEGLFLHDFSYAGYHQGAKSIPENLPRQATPISPPSGPAQRLFQEPPAKSNFLAATLPGPPGENH
jgi:hypothetical protein